MPDPIICDFCRFPIYPDDLVTVRARTCKPCWQEGIDIEIQSRPVWARWAMRRALRARREIERWQWQVW
jgi:hypothetical protein